MGGKTLKKLSLFCIYFFSTIACFSQAKISGILKAEDNTPLDAVSVIIEDESKSLIKYTYSNEKGIYILEDIESGKYILTFSSLGYETKSVPLTTDGQKNIIINEILKEKSLELDEVLLKSDRPISIKKDTISFKTKFFAQGNEQTVEDLLKKIPGLQIDNEGTIKIGNQEIEKLMVDGSDFFEKGYKVLSKNMPAYPIEEVEVLKNYSNNPLLKGIEQSNKVALNLKLNEKSKNIWFGNFEAGYGNDQYYEFLGNLMNFGKKNKFYFLTNLNDIGYDATGNVENLVRSFNANEPSGIGDTKQGYDLLSLSAPTLNFKKERTNFNNAELVSLNAIFNPTEKLEIKPIAFLNWDENNFFRNSVETVTTNSVNFTNTEDNKVRNKEKIAFGKIDLEYKISKTQLLESTTKYNNGDYRNTSNLLFNGTSTIENLNTDNTLFDQKINYTNKLSEKKALLLTGRYIEEKTPQRYRINRFFYEDLFPEVTNIISVIQESTNKMQFAGFSAHLLNKDKNENRYEIELGNQYRKDNLFSRLSLVEDGDIAERPFGYQNNVNYQVNDLYVKGKYIYKIKNLSLVSSINLHQFSNSLKIQDLETTENPFFINPSIGFNWKINEKNKISSSYQFNKNNAEIIDVYSDFVLTGFRSFSKGTGNFNQVDASSFTLNYQLGNWSDRFFANTSLFFFKNNDFFSTNTILDKNFSQSQKILIKDRSSLNISTNLDYYFKSLSSNLKLDLGYSKSDYKNIINNSDLRKINSENFEYGLELRSSFKGFFNYHFGTKWNTNTIETTIDNSFTNNLSFLDLLFVFNQKFDLQIQSEKYYFGNLQKDKKFYFLDFESRYKIKENKLTLGLSGKNLFNTEKFKDVSISDIGTSTTEYRLLPRYVLLKLEFRF